MFSGNNIVTYNINLKVFIPLKSIHKTKRQFKSTKYQLDGQIFA